MTLSRWQQVEQLFNQALLEPAGKRHSFVQKACAADADLCSEVISLLNADKHSDQILEQSVFPLVAHLIDDDFSRLLEKSDFASYKLQKLLGRGGMGAVFLAEDRHLERFVAIKVLPATFAEDSAMAMRFQREAKAVSSISHQNVAHIYEFGRHEGMYYFAMEYIPGKTLRQLINKKQVDISTAIEIALQVARALNAAHGEGVIHRDIKPENIMLRQRAIATKEISVKVLDFGLAKFSEQRSRQESLGLETTPGLIMGTTAYMSPEQARGGGKAGAEEIDRRTDLWSLGVVLYEMLAGERPFRGNTPSDKIAAILKTEPLAPSTINPSVPVELDRIILKLLQKECQERFETAVELCSELQQLRNNLGSEINQTLREQKPKLNLNDFLIKIKSHQKAFYVGMIALLFLSGGLRYWYFNNSEVTSAQKHPIKSIAVLPFQAVRGDPEDEYLLDGVTEAIISRLARLPGVTVKSRASVFQYKRKNPLPQSVGTDLSVEAVLLGRVDNQNGNLTIYAELVDARTGDQIWGEQYTRQSKDLFQLQSDIVRSIDDTIQAKPSSGENRQIAAKVESVNPEAYRLYLKGRYYWNKRTADDLRQAAECFDQAIAIDSQFALAYAGLADAFVLYPGYGAGTPLEFFPKAETAAKKALEIDETLAEAHASLGYVLFNYDWNFEESDRHMKRALELNPNYAMAHNWYGNANLLAFRRFDEAIEQLKMSQALEPLSIINNADLGNSYLYAGRYEEAIEQFRKTIALDPNFYYAHAYLGRTYLMKKMFREALGEYQIATSLNNDPRVLMLLGVTYAKMNKKGESTKILAELKAQSKQRYISSYYLALLSTALGRREEAFQWLEKAFVDREGRMTLIEVDPLLDDLRSDERFRNLARRIGLEQ